MPREGHPVGPESVTRFMEVVDVLGGWVGAITAGYFAWKVGGMTRELVNLEAARDKRTESTEARKQAEQISAWVRDCGGHRWQIVVFNGSNLPAFNLDAVVQQMRPTGDGGAGPVITSSEVTYDTVPSRVLPPGETILGWDGEVPPPESLVLFNLYFTDAAMRRWKRTSNGKLSPSA